MSEASTDPPPPSAATAAAVLLLPRREPFDYGLLPIPKLIFTDGTLTLTSLKSTLLSQSRHRVDAQTLADALQISIANAALVIQTLRSVTPSDLGADDVDGGGEVDVYDLLLFLYVQSYKRLVTKPHKDSASVADVWPSVSAFDGCLSAMSPLQLVRSNSRRFMPSQIDEEVHQLSYLQKHMANILTLLADSVEGEGDESLIITSEKFQHLEFLMQIVEKNCGIVSFSQAVSFFTNSDSDMPAVPVPATQVLEWILQNIASSLEQILEKSPSKENGSTITADLDNASTDACINTATQNSASPNGTNVNDSLKYTRNQTFVEGISKASVVKQASDIKGRSVEVANCHDSVIYILAPARYATVHGCSESTIVLGAIGKAVKVENCERVQVIVAAKRICIANCRECVFFLGVNQQPLIIGDNPKLQLAPYNTFYPQLEEHMAEVGINTRINRWNEPCVLGMVDPHDSLSHPPGVSDAQPEPASCLDPDQFTNFWIPKSFAAESKQPTKDNPFPLPEIYLASQKKYYSALSDIQQVIRSAQIEENRMKELACALHAHFKDWLYASGSIRQLYYLQND